MVATSGSRFSSQTCPQNPDGWSHSEVNGQLAAALDGIGGKPAYIYFVTANPINPLAPAISPGPVTLTLTTPAGARDPINTPPCVYPAIFQ